MALFPCLLYECCVLSCFNRVRLFVTLWAVGHQALLSKGFSRQEYWNRLTFPPSGDLPYPGIEPMSLMSPALAGGFFTTSTTWEALPCLLGSEVKVTQSSPTPCNPMDCLVHGILQARILEWVAFPFSRGSSQPRNWTQVSHTAGRFFTSWATKEAQEYWSG